MRERGFIPMKPLSNSCKDGRSRIQFLRFGPPSEKFASFGMCRPTMTYRIHNSPIQGVKGGRATIGVQRPSADPHIETFDDGDLARLT